MIAIGKQRGFGNDVAGTGAAQDNGPAILMVPYQVNFPLSNDMKHGNRRVHMKQVFGRGQTVLPAAQGFEHAENIG